MEDGSSYGHPAEFVSNHHDMCTHPSGQHASETLVREHWWPFVHIVVHRIVQPLRLNIIVDLIKRHLFGLAGKLPIY